MSCPVCSADSARPKLRVANEQIVECERCGLAWWQRPSGAAPPEQLYDAAYFARSDAAHGYDDYAREEPQLRHTFSRRLARLGRPVPGARLLDVGAAFGFCVSEARRAGWRAFGIEISRDAARQASRQAPGCIAVAHALRAPFPDASFAQVVLWDVLEHLADPHAAIAEVARVLAPDGQLALTTGDVRSLVARLSGARWHLYTLPEHLFFYSRESLVRLLADHGLRVQRMRAEGASYSVAYLFERLRKTLLRRASPGGRAGPVSRLRIPVNLFDIVTVHAVKQP